MNTNRQPRLSEHTDLCNEILAAAETMRVLHPERTGTQKYADDFIAALNTAYSAGNGSYWRLTARKAREWMNRDKVKVA